MIYWFDKLIIVVSLPFAISLGIPLCLLKLIFDGKPVFYKSVRYVDIKKPIVVFKFRTMRTNQEIINKEVRKYEAGGFQDIPLTSHVYTKFGRFLERTQLVELPQILNCLKGDMSLVGARPLPKGNFQEIIKLFGHEKVAVRGSRRSGLAGTAQMMGKSYLTNEQRFNIELLEAKFFINGTKAQKCLIYILIIFGTMLYVFRKRPSKRMNEFILSKMRQTQIDNIL